MAKDESFTRTFSQYEVDPLKTRVSLPWSPSMLDSSMAPEQSSGAWHEAPPDELDEALVLDEVLVLDEALLDEVPLLEAAPPDEDDGPEAPAPPAPPRPIRPPRSRAWPSRMPTSTTPRASSTSRRARTPCWP